MAFCFLELDGMLSSAYSSAFLLDGVFLGCVCVVPLLVTSQEFATCLHNLSSLGDDLNRGDALNSSIISAHLSGFQIKAVAFGATRIVCRTPNSASWRISFTCATVR